MSTPRQVNTMSKFSLSWKNEPMAPRRPNIFSSMRPVATGGITSGSERRVSTSDLPGQCWRANSHASASPNGRMETVLSAETQAVNQTICNSSALMRRQATCGR